MTERWKKMVEPHIQDAAGFCRIVDPMDVVNLLARQHRAMVRSVKGMRTEYFTKRAEALLNDYPSIAHDHEQRVLACDDILAALVKQGARKKD